MLDLRGICTFTDFYVLCTGASEPQLKAIASDATEQVRETFDIRPMGVDGSPMSQWVVADFGSVLLHVFHPSKRALYKLEELWNDVPRLKL